MVKFLNTTPLSLRIFWGGGVYKILLDPTPKIKIIICEVFEQYSITFKNIWGGYKIFLDSKNMIGNKVCSKTALYRCWWTNKT